MVLHSEEAVQFQVRHAFFRPESRMARDLGILAAQVYRQAHGSLRVLDAMAGSGVRSLRYRTEANADRLWVNDSNPDVIPELSDNLALVVPTDTAEPDASKIAQVTCLDANRIFFDCYIRQDYYDLVDVDCFGSAAPYLSTSLWAIAINGLLYLTSTDIRTVSGQPPQASLTPYGAYTRHHPAIHEQGLRIVLGTLLHNAAQKGFGIQPIFSLFTGQTFRLMVRLLSKPNLTPKNYGFLGYCHRCGTYQAVPWSDLGRSHCTVDQHPPTVSGPLWLGALHTPDFLQNMQTLAEAHGWEKATRLLQGLQVEAPLPPYFYTLGEIGRRGQCDIPRRSPLVQALHEAGFAASPTHFNPQALRTTADLPTCIAIARQLSDRSS